MSFLRGATRGWLERGFAFGVAALVASIAIAAKPKELPLAIDFKTPPTVGSASWQELSCASLALMQGNGKVLSYIAGKGFPYTRAALQRLQTMEDGLWLVEQNADPEIWKILMSSKVDGVSLEFMVGRAFQNVNRWWQDYLTDRCPTSGRGCLNDYYVMQGCKVANYGSL